MDLREVLRNISRSIKSNTPIKLSEFEAEEAPAGSPDKVHQATIRDVLRRRDKKLPQIFSGVSDDEVSPEELV